MRARGFTLVEVLVALAILAIALAAAMRAASVATEGAQETRLRTLATWVAQNRIAELTAARLFPGVSVTDGKSRMGAIEFDWRQTVSETPNPAFRKVELAVMRPGGGVLVTLNAYLTQAPGSSP